MADTSSPDQGSADAADLIAFVDASPTPYHAVAEATRRLEAAGFTEVSTDGHWESVPARGLVAAGGALVAWVAPDGAGPAAPLRIIGAHTDSPNLRVRPQPDTGRAGFRQVAVEVYGGALVNSWLDRDLGLAGRVAVRDGATGHRIELLRVDRPVLRVPQLAIHLDRDVWDKGLLLNRQQHLTPVWGLGDARPGELAAFVAARLGVGPDDVLSWDLMAHDLAPGTVAGIDDDFISSARLDDQLSCWAAVTALAGHLPAGDGPVAVVALFDHEEVGSESATGADGALLPQVLERLVIARGGDRAAFLESLARSTCVSADGAHATHPNYPERHEPGHQVALNAGPVVKLNANQRYATDADAQASFELACAEARVPVQRFASRNDMPCGSTIGPKTAAGLGIGTVDVGVAQLAMHSAREICGARDPAMFRRVLSAWLPR